MPREQVQERLIDSMRQTGSSVVTGNAGDQPGALPRINGDPTNSELPTDTAGVPVPLNYYDTSTDKIKYAVPNGSGGVHITVDVDLSGTLNLDGTTGLL